MVRLKHHRGACRGRRWIGFQYAAGYNPDEREIGRGITAHPSDRPHHTGIGAAVDDDRTNPVDRREHVPTQVASQVAHLQLRDPAGAPDEDQHRTWGHEPQGPHERRDVGRLLDNADAWLLSHDRGRRAGRWARAHAVSSTTTPTATVGVRGSGPSHLDHQDGGYDGQVGRAWEVAVRQVFISYARDDRPQVEELAARLRRLVDSVWFDSQLHGGEDWWAGILERIRSCDIFLAVVSAASLDSEACRIERQYAASVNRTIVPVALETLPPALPSDIATLQIVDFSTPGEQSLSDLARALLAAPDPEPLPEPLPDDPPAPLSYLTDLVDLIHAPRELTKSEQMGILLQLERGLGSADHDEREGARQVLLSMKQRDDLATSVEKTIDLLARDQVPLVEPAVPPPEPATSTPAEPNPAPPPHSPAPPPPTPSRAPPKPQREPETVHDVDTSASPALSTRQPHSGRLAIALVGLALLTVAALAIITTLTNRTSTTVLGGTEQPQPTPTATQTPTPTPTPTPEEVGPEFYAHLARSPLRVRAGPSTQTPQVASVPVGTTVRVICTMQGEAVTRNGGTSSVWDRIDEPAVGYVADIYVDTGDAPAPQPPCPDDIPPVDPEQADPPAPPPPPDPDPDPDPDTVAPLFLEGEIFSASSSGVQTLTDDGVRFLGYLTDGSWATYPTSGLRSGTVDSIMTRVASHSDGGTLILKADGSSGNQIGECQVSGTGGWTSWQDVYCEVQGDVPDGTTQLYVEFRGVGNPYLFNVDWIDLR